MVGDPGAAGQQTAQASQTRFSADGFWWWNGAEWKPAVSEDRLWRWNGQAWEPAQPARTGVARPGVGRAVGLTIALFAGVLLVVAVIFGAILYYTGPQITDVFSNVVAAMGGS
jgi:hypothetical protein